MDFFFFCNDINISSSSTSSIQQTIILTVIYYTIHIMDKISPQDWSVILSGRRSADQLYERLIRNVYYADRNGHRTFEAEHADKSLSTSESYPAVIIFTGFPKNNEHSTVNGFISDRASRGSRNNIIMVFVLSDGFRPTRGILSSPHPTQLYFTNNTTIYYYNIIKITAFK